MSNVEKRERKRVDYIINAVFNSEQGNQISCTIQDISMSGFYLKTTNPLPVSSKGQVSIQLQFGEEHKEVHVECIVARCMNDPENKENAGMAVQITKMDPDSSITLYNMIRYQSETSIHSNF